LIDDDIVVREVLAAMLTMGGYTVHTAEDGAAALELMVGGQCAPGAILLDVQLPGLSGIPLIRELRAHSSAGIYVISASTPPADITAAVDGVLLKPFGLEDLQRLLSVHESCPASPHVTFVSAGEPVISQQKLAQFRILMPESSIREIYSVLVDDLGHRIHAIEEAIAKGDHVRIRRIGHAIKGGCAMAGALQAARVGALIEAGALETENDLESKLLKDKSAVLRDLRNATANLKRMIDAGLPA
jgi:CheY-like chemotaxis protein/HPt (histidine-containing phosphotransfer) domain-containing protein